MIEWVGRKAIAWYTYLAALATLFTQAVLDLVLPTRQGRGETLRVLVRQILTASGGPLWGFSREQLQDVNPERALQHPNWKMGSKITIDSATLMNKGLEVIEARWLFDIPETQIEVLVH
ncbi:MAG TPA: hypothetical protein PK614_07755, partial [Nitrospira sp.]|nr:hypothetical protein [Nitrospira sp.]